MEFKAGDLIMYRKAEGPRWHGPGRIIGFDHKCCGPYIRGPSGSGSRKSATGERVRDFGSHGAG